MISFMIYGFVLAAESVLIPSSWAVYYSSNDWCCTFVTIDIAHRRDENFVLYDKWM